MPDILEVDSVLKTYGVRQVLTDIYLKCETGDIVGLLGRNGAGKTTLLKIIFGIIGAENSFVKINGVICKRTFKLKNAICYLPQDSFIPVSFSVERAVKLFVSKTISDSFFDDTVLFKHRKEKLSHLSGGEQRYLEIKLLLYSEKKFLLLDEPFTDVSPILAEKIKELIIERSHCKGIILTDHDYRNVLAVSNRLCLLHDGGIKNINDRSELVRWGYLSK